MKTRTVAALVLAAAACTRDVSGPPPRPTTGPPPSTHIAAPASPTTSAPPATVELKPGPHSPLADVDLPAGVAFVGNSSLEERWNYGSSYDDTVAFLRKQFAAGRKYDMHGATWWRDLPPCYNDTRHESPPLGWVLENSTLWVWANANTSLCVGVFGPSSTITPNEIVIDYKRRDSSYLCNRQ